MLKNYSFDVNNITAEYMSISTELQLFIYLKGTYLEDKIERSVYNKRRRELFDYTEKIRKRLSEKFAEFTDVFVVDWLCRTTLLGFYANAYL